MNNDETKLMRQIGQLFIKLSELAKEDSPLILDEDKRPAPAPAPVTLALPISFIDLIKSEAWPKAVDEDALVKTEEDKYERAEGIIDLMIEHHVESLKFLDFGCGEGHISKVILNQKPTLSIGYDIIIPENQIVPWEEKQDNLLLTTDFEKVKAEAPYDVILVYDVLDHAQDPIAVMHQIKELIHATSKVFIRCHPWCSRHGGHLYQDLNKAFAHLFLTDEEIKSLTGKDPIFCQKVIYPQTTYTEWFKNAGLKVRHENTDKTFIEDFFNQNTMVREALIKNIFDKTSGKFPKFQMEQSFSDYVLLNG